jgi:hypothetical protein
MNNFKKFFREASEGSDTENEKQYFEPGNIHKEEFREYWEKELKASRWVMETLRNGYRIPFGETPTEYEERNNASATKNMTVVKQLVAEMIESNIVRVVKEKPICVSPLGLVTRKTEKGVKHRLVFDASRWLNEKIIDQHVKLSHLEKALELTEENDYQATFDLKSAFYHIRIVEDQQKFLGAAIINTNGSKTYFVYKHLPFGLKCAVHGITKIMKPVLAKMSEAGIRATIYIDDGRILGQSREEMGEYLQRTYKILKNSGWIIEISKSDKKENISQKKKYLGFEIDSVKMQVKATDDKIRSTKKAIGDVLGQAEVEVKDLAKVLGKIVSLRPSHGPLARISSRSGSIDVDVHVNNNSKKWEGKLRISQPTKQELLFFMMNCANKNGFPIQNAMRAIRVEKLFKNAIVKQNSWPTFGQSHTNIVISDASETRAAIIELEEDEGKDEELVFQFSEEERKLSSGHRELLSVKKALFHWRNQERMKARRIYWATDSTNVVSFLAKGSSRPHIQADLFEIVGKLLELNSEIIPIHLSREDERIRRADELSKKEDSDDWSIDAKHFNELREEFKLEYDIFASDSNRRLEKYFTEFYSEKSFGTNALAQRWPKRCWMCPPVHLLPTIAKEIRRRTGCEGILTVPMWPTSSFYCLFFDKHENAKEPFKIVRKIKPYIYQNQGAKGALCGKVDFKIAILYFDKSK